MHITVIVSIIIIHSIVMAAASSLLGFSTRDSLLKTIALVVFLVVTNPPRAELDKHVLDTFKHSFFHGLTNLLHVNIKSSVGRWTSWATGLVGSSVFSSSGSGSSGSVSGNGWYDDDEVYTDYTNMYVFSYLHTGNKLYLGVGGMWVDPKVRLL